MWDVRNMNNRKVARELRKQCLFSPFFIKKLIGNLERLKSDPTLSVSRWYKVDFDTIYSWNVTFMIYWVLVYIWFYFWKFYSITLACLSIHVPIKAGLDFQSSIRCFSIWVGGSVLSLLPLIKSFHHNPSPSGTFYLMCVMHAGKWQCDTEVELSMFLFFVIFHIASVGRR